MRPWLFSLSHITVIPAIYETLVNTLGVGQNTYQTKLPLASPPSQAIQQAQSHALNQSAQRLEPQV